MTALPTSESPPPEGTPVSVDLEALRIHRPGEARSDGRVSSGRRRPPVGWVLLVLLAGLGGVLFGRGLRPATQVGGPVTVRVERLAGSATTAPARKAAGFAAAGWIKLPLHHPVHVTPLVEGRVEELLVIEGDRVGENHVIARLFAEEYQALLDVAEAAVRGAEAEDARMRAGTRPQEIAEARAEVERIDAEREVQAKILQRSEDLVETGAISLEELQTDQAELAALQAQVSKAGERLALLEEGFRKEDVDLAAAALARAEAQRDVARLRLGYTEIRAPIDGVVLQRHASRGAWVEPKDGIIVSLYDPHDLEARVDVSQGDRGRVFVGQQVEITTRAQPGRIQQGKVVLIEPRADLVKNTVPVRVRIVEPEEDAILHPDMVVTARFLAPEATPSAADASAPARPTVPAAAVHRENDGTHWVWAFEDGHVRRVEVEVEDEKDGRVPVTEGLRRGAQVVIEASGPLADGDPVRVRTDT